MVVNPGLILKLLTFGKCIIPYNRRIYLSVYFPIIIVIITLLVNYSSSDAKLVVYYALINIFHF